MPGRKDASEGGPFPARGALAVIAGLVAIMIGITASSSGAGGLVVAQASASPSGGPTGPSIKLLNPSGAYDPGLFPETQAPVTDDPKISDKFDGIDNAYHVVAAVSGAPSGAIVEAAIQYEGANEITVGELSPVPDNPNVYELFWDVPDGLSSGSATFVVRLFGQTSNGTDEVANDSVAVDVEHKDGDPPTEAEETAEWTWPSQNGPLGFYKPRGGQWRTFVEGFASASTVRVLFAYSTTPLGKAPKFTSCSGQITPGSAVNNRKPFSGQCALTGKDLPTQVTSLVVIAADIDNTHSGALAALSMDAADVHVVKPYVQTPDQMTLSLLPFPGPSNFDGTSPPDRGRRVAGDGCVAWTADVQDPLHRPVIGANIDVHLTGPNDSIQFGDDDDTGEAPGTFKNPDKGSHTVENGTYCNDPPDSSGGSGGGQPQAEHNVPGGNDIKHRESVGGTGVGGGAGPGQWKFYLYSETPGFTDITAWIDDEDIATLDEMRPADTDTLDPGEPVATARAQWYPQAPTLDFVPLGASGAVGSCTKFTLRARGGSAPIPGINVDIHAQGPNGDLDFCDPGDGTAHRAPDLGDHNAEDGGESSDKASSPPIQHTEGETDAAGNFVLGVVSPATGDTTLSAWIDGEKGFDNDVRATAEPSASATMTWATSATESKVSFLNPSPYGDATFVSNKKDVDVTYHIVTRVDSAIPVQGVELQLGTGTGADFEKSADLGLATQVAGSDTWELQWPAAVDDDTYTLRAHIVGTSSVADQEITVNNEGSLTDPTDAQDETVELTRPLNAAPVAFSRGATPVEGVASAGADALDLFYSKAGGNATPPSGSWIACGTVDLSGASTVQTFKGTCKINPQDQAFQVTAIAALAFDCMEPFPGNNCDTTVDPDTGIRQGANDSGDAHRIFGFEASPLVGLSPAENEDATGGCAKFVMRVTDQTGQALTGQNVDVHLTGPEETPNFCDPADGSASPRRAPDQGGHSVVSGHGDQGAHVSDGPDTQHTEGETNAQGAFVFGVKGNEPGDSRIEAFIDRNDNDVQDPEDGQDSALMHWVSPNACTQTGTAHGDVLTGTTGFDRICGRGGNDVIRGMGGNDVLLGAGGADVIKGGRGNDRASGGAGSDRLFGNAGNDSLKGGSGKDVLNGGAGRDACKTGPGRDKTRKCESGRSPSSSPRLVRGGTA